MSLPEPSLPGPNQINPNYPEPKIHTSRLIATANQKINLEVTVLEVTRHQMNISIKYPNRPKLEIYRQHRRPVDSQSNVLFQRPKPIETQQFFSQSLKNLASRKIKKGFYSIHFSIFKSEIRF